MMPEADSPMRWRAAFDILDDRRVQLRRRVNAIGMVLLVAAFIAGVLAITPFLPNGTSLHLWFWAGGGIAGSALIRALLSAIPGFGWAKELKLLADTLEPYDRYFARKDGAEALS